MKAIRITLVAIFLCGCVAPTTQRMAINSVSEEIEAKKQREMALQTMVEDNLRLYKVAYQIKTKAHSLCDATTHAVGAVVINNEGFGAPFKEAATSVYGMTDILKVFYIQPGSPADSAGMKVESTPKH